MNKLYETLLNHRSIRSYTDQPVSEQELNLIINSVQAAPSSINGQQVSVISVQDRETKEKIAELTGNQPWVAQAPVFLLFCADFFRAKIAAELNGENLAITESLESILVGATDVGLAMGNAIAVAESLGLGIVPIGGARNKPLELIELLGIPEYVFPVSGLVVGHPADLSAKKPRLPQKAIWHKERYDTDLEGLIKEYDQTISTYMKKRTNGKETRGWSQEISSFYNHIYYTEVRQMLEQQGYDFK
ncbi:NADPH-dependent oxidoreductase [Peribacillus simplex]|uniref:NADPH-dependent oxidoreductase n=1 Tax=Peribacillus frigoritolerans TaxID=450367 RepID=UPI000BBA1878|nr:NADPH-dependent oxidoreductase [Peribacillus frigoritolerans]MEB2494559.1 NADPH-dependent oxidoreductase [Peribacillus frigoritolerans]PCD05033.1 NADPH-dependent oxidoreductase [Peribacillus simplex]